FLHGLEDARARFRTRLTPLPQVEDKQRVARNGAPEPGRRPATGGDEGFDGLPERCDVTHGAAICIGMCLAVNRSLPRTCQSAACDAVVRASGPRADTLECRVSWRGPGSILG